MVLFDIVNRGRLRLLSQFSRGEVTNEPTTEAHFGDGSLLKQGYTLVAVGWQFDVKEANPIATENGETITGWVRARFIPVEVTDSFEYVTGYNTVAYPPINLDASRRRPSSLRAPTSRFPDRARAEDLRLSIEERYAGREDYLAKVERAGNRLAQERYILRGDVPLIVEDAGRHWDWRMTEGKSAQSP